MSYDETDALYEEGMSLLYADFKRHYEEIFVFERIDQFYRENSKIIKEPLQNLTDSIALFNNKFFTAAFLHAIISIEVGIKVVALKPILYSLAINNDS